MADSKTAEKIYPKRTLKKKPFFDEEPWETVENRKKNSRSKTKKSTDDKAKTNLNENGSKGTLKGRLNHFFTCLHTVYT